MNMTSVFDLIAYPLAVILLGLGFGCFLYASMWFWQYFMKYIRVWAGDRRLEFKKEVVDWRREKKVPWRSLGLGLLLVLSAYGIDRLNKYFGPGFCQKTTEFCPYNPQALFCDPSQIRHVCVESTCKKLVLGPLTIINRCKDNL